MSSSGGFVDGIINCQVLGGYQAFKLASMRCTIATDLYLESEAYTCCHSVAGSTVCRSRSHEARARTKHSIAAIGSKANVSDMAYDERTALLFHSG